MESSGYDRVVGITSGAPRRRRDADRELSEELKRAHEATDARLAAEKTDELAPPADDGSVRSRGEFADSAPEDELPGGMAVLMVNERPTFDNEPGFVLKGQCCALCGPLETAEPYEGPPLELGDLMTENGQLSAEIQEVMQYWSESMAELIIWLYRCKGRHPSNFRLVIWDNTGYHIPWELFWLKDPPEQDPGWLGALLTVTRWLTPRDERQGRDYWRAYRCEGPVAAYVDEGMDAHLDLLAALFDRVRRSPSMTQLADYLDVPQPDPLSLVYVACEGRFDDEAVGSGLGDLPLASASRFRRLRKPAQTLIFLNAAYSGAVGISRRRFRHPAVQRGFAHAFLQNGAVGVLAISARVEPGDTYRLADDLLAYLKKHRDKPVADALRELRYEAWRASRCEPEHALVPSEAAGQQPGDQGIPALYRFMYVYYGSPFTVLAIPGGS